MTLQSLATHLARPGMTAVTASTLVAHGQEQLRCVHRQPSHACPRLVEKKPDVFVPPHRSEAPSFPIVTPEQERRPGDVDRHRSSYFPPEQVEEQERHQECQGGTTDRLPTRQHRRDHGFEKSRRVPIVVVHLLAEPALRSLHPGVELGPERSPWLDANEAP